MRSRLGKFGDGSFSRDFQDKGNRRYSVFTGYRFGEVKFRRLISCVRGASRGIYSCPSRGERDVDVFNIIILVGKCMCVYSGYCRPR